MLGRVPEAGEGHEPGQVTDPEIETDFQRHVGSELVDVRGAGGDGDKRHPQSAEASESGEFYAADGGRRRRRREEEVEDAECYELQKRCRRGDAIRVSVSTCEGGLTKLPFKD